MSDDVLIFLFPPAAGAVCTGETDRAMVVVVVVDWWLAVTALRLELLATACTRIAS